MADWQVIAVFTVGWWAAVYVAAWLAVRIYRSSRDGG